VEDIPHVPHGKPFNGEFSYIGSGHVSLFYWRGFS